MHSEICQISHVSTFTAFHKQPRAAWLHELQAKKAQCNHHSVDVAALPRLPVTTGCKYREVLISFSGEKKIMHYNKETVHYVYLCNN